MDNKGFYTIQSWMLELPLSLVETAIYAVIYGFSQDGATRYQGSLAYLASKAKCTKNTARKALQNMVAAGLIERYEKEVNGVTFNDYACKNVAPLKFLEGGTQKIAPHNNIDNDIDKSISIKNKRGFVPPTFDEVDFYCCERGNSIDPQAFIDYYTSNGWKVGNNPMKDWKAAVRTWEKREQQKPAKPAAQSTQKKSYFQHNNEILEKLLGGGQSNG